MSLSKIQWTDRTWNPTRGCSRVSEGCRNCYAERIAARHGSALFSRITKAGPKQSPFVGFAKMTSSGPSWTGRVELIPEKLDEPLRWRKPSRIFVNSMSDLFHEKLPVSALAQVFDIMASATLNCDKNHRLHEAECWAGEPHTFQILTKRPAQMFKMLTDDLPFFLGNYFPGDAAINVRRELGKWPLPNVWLGVSIEDQATADERIPLLRQTPAAVRFVSYEPALAAVNFKSLIPVFGNPGGIHWLIIGGESGTGARPFDLAWARSTIAQCKAAGVSVFVKQLGAYPIIDQRFDRSISGYSRRLRDRKGGDPEEWPEDLRVREFPAQVAS